MQPDNQNPQQQNNWSPQSPSPYSFADLPPVDPRAKRRKKLLIIVGISLGVLLVLAVISALVGGGGGSSSPMQSASSTAQTKVELTNYDRQGFSFNYPKSLNVLAEEALEDRTGWFVSLKPSETDDSYDVSLVSSDVEPEYATGEEAVVEIMGESVSLQNIQTSDVVIAGVKSKKTTATFNKDEATYVIVYAYAHPDDTRHLEVTAVYDQKLTDITGSLDVLLGSIKLK